MRKTLLSLFVVSFLLATVPGFSYIIDGNLDDWGVTPFTDWAPDSPTADFNEEDNIAHPWPENPWTDVPLREGYDLEAMYFDDDADYLYFGIITSNNYSGAQWASEDLAIDLDNDGYYEIGADIAAKAGETPLPLNTLTTRAIYNVSQWNVYRNAEYSIKTGTQIGTFEIYNRYLGAVETPPGAASFTPDTYILEGRISKLLFGDIACGQMINLFFTRITCLKDYIRLAASCNGNCGNGVIPEPTTLLLFGSGLAGALSLRRKKK